VQRSGSCREFFVQSEDSLCKNRAGGVFFAKEQSQVAQLQVEFGDGRFAVAEARVEFTLAQCKHVGAYI